MFSWSRAVIDARGFLFLRCRLAISAASATDTGDAARFFEFVGAVIPRIELGWVEGRGVGNFFGVSNRVSVLVTDRMTPFPANRAFCCF